MVKKANKTKKKEVEESEKELGEDIEDAEEDVKKLGSVISNISNDEVVNRIAIKGSKPISQLKKGDKVKVDGVQYEIDAHYILIDHGRTKEMTIEIFNPKTDKDYQLRYFSDQAETSMEFYELQEIVYVRRSLERVEW